MALVARSSGGPTHQGIWLADLVHIRMYSPPWKSGSVTDVQERRCCTCKCVSRCPRPVVCKPFVGILHCRKKIVFVSGRDAIAAVLLPHMEPACLYHTMGGDKPEHFDAVECSERMHCLDTERDAGA